MPFYISIVRVGCRPRRSTSFSP